MTRRMRPSIVLALFSTLLSTLLLARPALAEQCQDCDPGPDPDPPSVAVTLSLGATPTYGSDLHASVSTDKPAMDGGVSIAWERSGSADVTLVSGPEGDFDIPTAPRFTPGQTYYLRAHASKEDGSEGASARIGFTVDPITSALEFLTTQPGPGGPVTVRVIPATPSTVVPTGTMTLTVGTTSIGSATLDAGGVASFGEIQPGTYANTVASYAGDGIYQAGTAAATITTRPYSSAYAAQLSAAAVTQGDAVSVHVTPGGGTATHPATGSWQLLAGLPGDDQSVVTTGTSDGVTPFDVDITAWAHDHVGTWSFTLAYGGNVWVGGFHAEAFGQLTVAKHRMTTSSELEVASTVSPGARVTARVTGTEPTGGPVTGAVALYDGPTLLATGQVGADGSTTLTLPATLAAGQHRLRVEYAGSADHLPSTSAVVTVTVTGTGIAAKTQASVGGTLKRAKRTVTLTVVVAGATTPTGTVQIRDGKRLVKTVTLSGGRAVVRLKGLKKGRHTLTATYLGSTSLLGGQHRWTVRVR